MSLRLESSLVSLLAIASCWSSASMRGSLPPSAQTVPATPAATLTGRIVWSDGRPAEDAVLELRSEAELLGEPRTRQTLESKTADGAFQIALEPGTYWIEAWAKQKPPDRVRTVHKDGRPSDGEIWARWSSQALRVTTSAPEPIVLTLEPGVPLVCAVRGEDGTALRRFTLHARRLDADLASVERVERLISVRSDSFVWHDLAAGHWEITATLRGSAPATPCTIELGPFLQPLASIDLAVRPFARVSGRLVDRQDHPLAGATIRARYDATPVWIAELATATATTNTRGDFVLRSLIPEPLRLEVELDSGAREIGERFDLAPGEPRERVTLRLERH